MARATSKQIGLPSDGDVDEPQQLVEQHPLLMPEYRLERVNVAVLNVDYAPPYGNGYARPLSEARLRTLRRTWDPLAVSPLVLSRRVDGLYVIDGNHRRFISFEKGQLSLPAMVHSNLSREQEADLYTKLGTVLGQTPWTRFQSKLVALDPVAIDIVKIAQQNDLDINFNKGYSSGKIRAVARIEWVYARGGPQALDWVLDFLANAFNGDPESLGELQLEGTFGFYLRYHEKVNAEEVSRILGAAGMNAWHDRAASIWQRVDLGPRANTYGHAIVDMVNDTWKKQGKTSKQLLQGWSRNLGFFPKYDAAATFSSRLNRTSVPDIQHDPAPQQLAKVG